MPTSEHTPLTPNPEFSTHEKQERAVQSDARFRILEWGRRGGKNITAVMDLIERARHPWTSEWGNDDPANVVLWWVGRSYDQAEKYGFNKFKNAVPNSWIEKKSRSEPYELHLTNGVTIEFRTYDHPDTLQGAGVDHISVDEADYMPDSLWWDDLEPMLMDSLGSAMFISKPQRPRSYFHQLKERGKSDQWDDYFYCHATSADNPFIAEDPADKRGTMPDHKFRQQYLAELPDDGTGVIDDLDGNLFTGQYQLFGELTGDANAVTGEVYAPQDIVVEPCSTGADFAQSRDYRVTITVDAEGKIVYFKRSQNESWGDIFAHIQAVADRFPGIVAPDATRDNKIIADLWNAGVDIEPVKFAPQRKRELIENLISDIEREELTAADDPRLEQLRTELRILEKETTRHGYTKYHAPESGYDDCVDALALAADARSEAMKRSPGQTARTGGRDDGGDTDGDRIQQAISQYQQEYRDVQRGGKWS
jgi:hypothetical protein